MSVGGAGPGAVIGTAAGQPVVSAGLGAAGKTAGYGGASYVGQPGGLGADASLGKHTQSRSRCLGVCVRVCVWVSISVPER